jgi:hypothetical protein
MDDALGLVGDHFDEHFDDSLEAARHARGGLACGEPEQEDSQQTERDRIEHRIDVDHAPVHDVLLRVAGVVEVRQVMNDVLGCGGGVPFCSHGQVFTKNANKFALSARMRPISMPPQWRSG